MPDFRLSNEREYPTESWLAGELDWLEDYLLQQKRLGVLLS